MDTITDSQHKRKLRVNMRAVLFLASGLVLYLFINMYMKKLAHDDNEQLALGATILFLGAVYTGRFLSPIWAPKNRPAPDALLVILPVIIVGCAFLAARMAWSLFSHKEVFYLFFLLLPFIVLAMALGLLVKLVRLKISFQLQEARAGMAQSQSELHLLQSQLSPHFLFNTLNNIYGISITQHEKIPGLLLKLSELLRYSVYDTKELFVPLKDELKYINNYIDFERMRLGDRLELTTALEPIENPACKIAPMLLIIFIENAFKHSKNSTEQKIYIDIALKTWGDSILFSIKNSYQKNNTKVELERTQSGFGLANAQKRLELLYPNRFDLKIDEGEDIYTVILRITVK